MKKTISKFFAFGFTILCLTGCGNIKGFIEGVIKDSIQPPKPTIILCHGLNGHPSHLEFIERSMQSVFSEADVINTHEIASAKNSITKQSDDLLKTLENRNLDKKKPVVFIAHSQGGLRAYLTAQKLNSKGFKVLVVTLGTPWKGSHLLGILSGEHERYKEHLKKIKKIEPVAALIQEYERALNEDGLFGILDMVPRDNKFLKGIHKKLKNNKIPILAIGGDMSSLVEPILQVFSNFQEPYKSFKALMDNKPHDLVVQLSSQLAEDIEPKNFKKVTVPATHIPLTKGVPSELTSPKVIEEITTFIYRKAR